MSPKHTDDHRSYDEEFVEDSNPTANPEFASMIVKRRTILKGGAGLMTAGFFGALPLAGCATSNANMGASTVNGANTPKRPPR